MPSPDPQRQRLVMVGASVRWLATAAARAGLEVHAVDLFGDLDLRAAAASTSRPAAYPEGLPAAAASLPAGPWLYTGAVENHPEVIAAIARERPLAGCPAPAVALVRDHRALAEAVRAAGLGFPETRFDPAGVPTDGSWLLKPRRSAGGHGVRPWRGPEAADPGLALERDHVWQRRVAGRVAAAAYLLAGDGPRLLAASRQLVGRRWCHARPFQYCGSVDAAPESLPTAAAAGLLRLGELLAARFGLRGLVGVDVVVDRGGGIQVLEINPRPTASMELIERATGFSPLVAHLAACGVPTSAPVASRPRSGTWSKAILFAARDLPFDESAHRALVAAAGGPLAGWPSLADIPCPPQVIAAGRPVCTLFAHGPSPRTSLTCLRRRTAAVAAALGRLTPPADAGPAAAPRETA